MCGLSVRFNYLFIVSNAIFIPWIDIIITYCMNASLFKCVSFVLKWFILNFILTFNCLIKTESHHQTNCNIPSLERILDFIKENDPNELNPKNLKQIIRLFYHIQIHFKWYHATRRDTISETPPRHFHCTLTSLILRTIISPLFLHYQSNDMN